MEQIHAYYNQALALVGDDRWVQAATIIVAFMLLAKIVQIFITRGIAVWARRTKTELDDRLIELLRSPILWSVALVGIWLALKRVGLEEPYAGIAFRLLTTIALLLWLRASVRATTVLLEAAAELEDKLNFVEPRTLALLNNTAKVVLFAGAIYLLLLTWGINVGGWLVTGGVLGIVLGLAAQDSLANLFAGMFILADAPYEVGDFINLDTGERGRVTHVGLRSTRLLTRDDIEVTVPNSVIAQAKIINETGGPWEKERIRATVAVAYGSDIDRVRDLLMEIAADQPLLLTKPEPRVRIRGLGDFAVQFQLMGWIDEPVLRGRALDELYATIYKRLRQEGIEIPYPKRDLYLHRAKEKWQPIEMNPSDDRGEPEL